MDHKNEVTLEGTIKTDGAIPKVIPIFMFLSPPVQLHGGLICITFRLSGCQVRKIQTRKKFMSQKVCGWQTNDSRCYFSILSSSTHKSHSNKISKERQVGSQQCQVASFFFQIIRSVQSTAFVVVVVVVICSSLLIRP